MDYDNEEIKEIIIQDINKRFEIGKREYGQGLKWMMDMSGLPKHLKKF